MGRLALENVSKSFSGPRRQQIAAVRDLSLKAEEGELLAIVGPSGCGKTTTLRLIAGLETPDAGDIFMDGKPLDGVPPQDRDVAMVFQDHALFPHLTVFENMALGLRLRKVPRAETGVAGDGGGGDAGADGVAGTAARRVVRRRMPAGRAGPGAGAAAAGVSAG